MYPGALPYFGSTSFYAYLIQSGGHLVLDPGIPAKRHSQVNRTRILGANGPVWLSLPIHRPNGSKTPWSQVEIDGSQNWKRDHLMGIRSAYGKAPFFEHYWPDVERLIQDAPLNLMEFNRSTLEWACTHLDIPLSLDSGDPEPSNSEEIHLEPYIQVFCDRFDFIEDLSVLDILFCSGPETYSLLS